MRAPAHPSANHCASAHTTRATGHRSTRKGTGSRPGPRPAPFGCGTPPPCSRSANPSPRRVLVTAIGFSRDGRMVATGSLDGTVRLWDSGTGKPIGQPMTGNGYVTSIAFSRDGHLLAAGILDSTLRLWDTGTFQPVGDPMRTDAAVTAAAFSPDGRTLATGSGDGSIRLWDVGDRTQLGAPLTGHTAGVISLDFSPDGTKLLSGSVDHTLRMWPVPAASPDGLCAKLTHNMSHEQWSDWVSTRHRLHQGVPRTAGRRITGVSSLAPSSRRTVVGLEASPLPHRARANGRASGRTTSAGCLVSGETGQSPMPTLVRKAPGRDVSFLVPHGVSRIRRCQWVTRRCAALRYSATPASAPSARA